MKTLIKPWVQLQNAGRWDIDFHLPSELVRLFDVDLLKPVKDVAVLVKEKRDPSGEPEQNFQYVDIASIDVSTGRIVTPQELAGEEAPSRARKVISAFDLVVSTCRPTRGAIAVVPPGLHGEIASTAFTILRAREGVNPFYLHFALRLDSTKEQFRKWSTGSSYPAILDEDVEKTLIPLPSLARQDEIAQAIAAALQHRDDTLRAADGALREAAVSLERSMFTNAAAAPDEEAEEVGGAELSFPADRSYASVRAIRIGLQEVAEVVTQGSLELVA